MIAVSSLSHSTNFFSLNSMRTSIIRSPKSIVEVPDDMADSVMTRRKHECRIAREI